MVSSPLGPGHDKVGKLLTYSNILELLRQMKMFTFLGQAYGKNKRKMFELTKSFKYEANDDSEESLHELLTESQISSSISVGCTRVAVRAFDDSP